MELATDTTETVEIPTNDPFREPDVACLVCGTLSYALYCGYLHMVQHLGPQLVVATPDFIDRNGPIAEQTSEGWILEAAQSFDIYDDWLNGIVRDWVSESKVRGFIRARARTRACTAASDFLSCAQS
jgi:hypothetical protein